MMTILGILAAVAVLFGIGALLFSHESSPAARFKEAGVSALTGAFMAGSCIVQLVLGALGLLLGLFFLSLILKSCS